MGSGCNSHHKQTLSTGNFWLWLHSTEGLFLKAVALTSHWNFLTTLAFLECFYMVLINKKQVLKESEDFFSPLLPNRLIQEIKVPAASWNISNFNIGAQYSFSFDMHKFIRQKMIYQILQGQYSGVCCTLNLCKYISRFRIFFRVLVSRWR